MEETKQDFDDKSEFFEECKKDWLDKLSDGLASVTVQINGKERAFYFPQSCNTELRGKVVRKKETMGGLDYLVELWMTFVLDVEGVKMFRTERDRSELMKGKVDSAIITEVANAISAKLFLDDDDEEYEGIKENSKATMPSTSNSSLPKNLENP